MPASGSPIGTTPFGTSTPVSAPDPPTAGPAIARYISPGSGDYQLDTTVGQLAKMPAIRQRMLLIARTMLGSSSTLPDMGIRIPDKIDQYFDRNVRASVRTAYRRMTDIERSVRIDDIIIENDGIAGRRTITIAYTDLTQLSDQDRNQQIEVPL